MSAHARRRPVQVPKPTSEQGATPASLNTRIDQATPIALADAIVQAKSSVGPANDVYEHQADAVANRVVRYLSTTAPEAAAPDTSASGSRVQRAATVFGGEVADRSPGGRIHRTAMPSVSAGPDVAAPHRIQRAGFTYGGQGEVRGSISKPQELRAGIEGLLDNTFVGVRALFDAGGVVTSVEAWGELLFGLLAEDNDIEGLTPADCTEIVENIKAENRKEQFLQISEFFGYFDESYDPPVWTLDVLKSQLITHRINVDEGGKDDATLEALLAARGDREALKEDSARSFQFGTDTEGLDIEGLKSKLDEELGEKVNWGHEITDCLDDSGKPGEMYYYQSGAGLKQVGETSQSHASSKGGRTIIWQTSGKTTEILAIGKHTTRADSRLSSGASYEIVKTFGAGYSGYVGKIIGFAA